MTAEEQAIEVLFAVVDAHRRLERYMAPAFGVITTVEGLRQRRDALATELENARRFLEGIQRL